MHNATTLVPYCTPQMHSITPLVTHAINACFFSKK
jgi:hypothetical protein